jgi:hypothetical protein
VTGTTILEQSAVSISVFLFLYSEYGSRGFFKNFDALSQKTAIFMDSTKDVFRTSLSPFDPRLTMYEVYVTCSRPRIAVLNNQQKQARI